MTGTVAPHQAAGPHRGPYDAETARNTYGKPLDKNQSLLAEDAALVDVLVDVYCQLVANAVGQYGASSYVRVSEKILEEASVIFLARIAPRVVNLEDVRSTLEQLLSFYEFAKGWENGRVKGSNGAYWYSLSEDDRRRSLKGRASLPVLLEAQYIKLEGVNTLLVNTPEPRSPSALVNPEQFFPPVRHGESGHSSFIELINTKDTSSGDTINDIAQQLLTLKFATYTPSVSESDDELSLFLSEISPFVYTRYYKQGDVLCEQGEQAKAMFFILKGTVQVTSSDGEIVYAELEPVSYFGEIGILYDTNRTATVSAKTKCTIAVLKAADFKEILTKYPSIKKQLFKEADHRLSQLRDRNEVTSRKTSKGLNPVAEQMHLSDGHSKENSTTPGDNDSNTSNERQMDHMDEVNSGNYLKLSVPNEFSLNVPKSPSFSNLIPHSSPSSVTGEYPDEIAKPLQSSNSPLLSVLRSPSIESCNRSAKSRSASSLSLVQSEGHEGSDSSGSVYDEDTSDIPYEFPSKYTTDANVDEDSGNDNHMKTFSELSQNENSNSGPTILTKNHSVLTQASGRRRASIAPWSENFTGPTISPAKSSTSLRKFSDSIPTIKTSEASPLKPTVTNVEESEDDGNFPSKVVNLIASFLDFKTLRNLSQVNSYYHKILGSYNPEKIDLLSLNKKMDDSTLDTILTNYGSNVRKLYLTNCWDLTNDAATSINKVSQTVTTLSLANSWNLSDAGLEGIALPHCKHISLTNLRKIRSQGVISIMSISRVETIALAYCKSVGNDALIHNNWKYVKSADFSRCTGISDEGFLSWASMVSEDNEYPLENDAMDIDDDTGLKLSPMTITPSPNSQFFAMKTLFLNDCSFLSSEVLETLFPIMPQLETLSLSFCCALTEFPDPPSSLKNLDLSFCPLATDELILKLSTLEILALRGCVCITGDGLWAIRNKNLKLLGYTGAAITRLKEIEATNQESEKFPWDILKATNIFESLAIKF